MSRRGYSLVELLFVMVIITMLLLWAVAPMRSLRDGAAVREESHRVVEALDAARGAAVRLGTTTRLVLSDSAYLVSAVTLSGDSITAWRDAGAAAAGVHLSGTSAALQFGPAGIAMGVSNRTLTLTRGSATRKVVISRLGRITQ